MTNHAEKYEGLIQALQRFSKLFNQNIRPQETCERWMPRTQESPHELARQSEAKRKQAPQSEANVCRRRWKCTLKKKPPLLIAQDTQHKLRVAFEVRERNNDKYHHAYYTVTPLSHRFLVHVVFPLNLQGNPFKIMSLPLLKLIVCARHYSHRRISLSKDVGRDLWGVHQQLQSDSGTCMY